MDRLRRGMASGERYGVGGERHEARRGSSAGGAGLGGEVRQRLRVGEAAGQVRGEREGVRLLFKERSGAAPCTRGQGKSGLGTDAEVGAVARCSVAGNRAELGDERYGPLGRGLARALGRPSQ